MTQEYRNFIKSIHHSMGENAERYILLIGYLLIGSPIYCVLLLFHIHFAGLKKSDYDIATTFLPLFSLREMLTYMSIFLVPLAPIEFLDFILLLGQMVSIYVLLVLVLEIAGKKEWSQKIRLPLVPIPIPIKESFYSREFINHKGKQS